MGISFHVDINIILFYYWQHIAGQLTSLDVVPSSQSCSPAENDYYSKLYPPNRASIEENAFSDEEMEEEGKGISVTQSLAISGQWTVRVFF